MFIQEESSMISQKSLAAKVELIAADLPWDKHALSWFKGNIIYLHMVYEIHNMQTMLYLHCLKSDQK